MVFFYLFQTSKDFLLFAEAEVRSLASLYSGVVSLCFEEQLEHLSFYNGKKVFFIIWNVLQGRNVDALILYFGEDPSRCPFEQGIVTGDQCVMELTF